MTVPAFEWGCLLLVGGAHRIDRKAVFHAAAPDGYILRVPTADNAMDGLIERLTKVREGLQV
jgi:hypothetical protein